MSNVTDINSILDERRQLAEFRERRHGIAIKTAGALGLTSLLLLAVNHDPQPSYTSYPARAESGTIEPGVLRYDPLVKDEHADGESNVCGELTTPLALSPQDVLTSYGPNDVNGEWIGLNVDSVELPEDCETDSDGTVWVIGTRVTASIQKAYSATDSMQ